MVLRGVCRDSAYSGNCGVQNPAVPHSGNQGFPHSRASPYENRQGQIRLQAADLSLRVFALLIAYADIIP